MSRAKRKQDIKTIAEMTTSSMATDNMASFFRSIQESRHFGKLLETSHDIANAMLDNAKPEHKKELALELVRFPKLMKNRDMGVMLRAKGILSTDIFELEMERLQPIPKHVQDIMRDIEHSLPRDLPGLTKILVDS